MEKPKLEDVCLCAIVKNEEVNPAGGIVDYVNSIVPYVGSAVIVDTGSTDNTLGLLRDCEREYPNLKVCGRSFPELDPDFASWKKENPHRELIENFPTLVYFEA